MWPCLSNIFRFISDVLNSEFRIFPAKGRWKEGGKALRGKLNVEIWNFGKNWKNWKFWKFGKLKNSKHVMAGFRRFASPAQECKERDSTLTLMRNPGTIAQMDGSSFLSCLCG